MTVYIFLFKGNWDKIGLEKRVEIDDNMSVESMLALFKTEYKKMLDMTNRHEEPSLCKVMFANPLDGDKTYLVSKKNNHLEYTIKGYNLLTTVFESSNNEIRRYVAK